MKSLTAIVLAGGSGTRMELGVTKQKIVINGESVLHRTVRAFEECLSVSDIIVVVRSDETEFADNELQDLKKIRKVVSGGRTRIESAKNGFSSIDWETDYVAIHDGARCLVTPEMITAVFEDAVRHGAASASTRLTDTVKTVDENGFVSSTVNRENIRIIQTPQIFESKIYEKAIKNADIFDSGITDDNMLVERLGYKIYLTETGKNNIKITVKDDLLYANYLLNGDKNNV